MAEARDNQNSTKPNSGTPISLDSTVEKINQGFKEKEIADRAKELGLGYVEIQKHPVNPDVFEFVPYQKAKTAELIPFSRIGNQISVAVVNPNNPETKQIIEDLKTQHYLQVKTYLASKEGILQALNIFADHFLDQYAQSEPQTVATQNTTPADYREEIAVLKTLGETLHNLGESQEGLEALEDGAFRSGASDLHFQPGPQKTVVRFRIDGVLNKVTELDNKVYQFFLTQIKHKSGMKINVVDVPQDGRYSLTIADKKVDVRVSSLPTEDGESLVLRLLDSNQAIEDLVSLGFSEPLLSQLEAAKKLSQGMIMVTGPTGSGKSTTLYSLLRDYNQPDRKVITLEDPVEYKIPGVVQSPIAPLKGYTFEKGLEAILRQDPDVIMVGEIRNKATAETSAQAALTGHIVLCTLHTNNAIEAIPRFINMGVKPFIAAPALHLIVAQRLVRRLCSDCKKAQPIAPDEKAFIESVLASIVLSEGAALPNMPETLFTPIGCEKCSETGYKGRTVIAEGFIVTESVAELILKESSTKTIRELLIKEQKMTTMLQDGVLKVLNGTTSLAEIRRAANF